MLRSALKRIERALLFATPLRRLVVPRYQYAFSPGQLAFLYRCFQRSHAATGVSLEIGCFVGATTVFLNAAYRYGELPRRDYLAIDTFAGFTAADLAHERDQRGKRLEGIDDAMLFAMNSQRRFDYTMAVNGFGNVRSLKADVATVKLAELAPRVAFALVDVDLYRPTRSALDQLAPLMAPGGVIVVDDCIAQSEFDGSLQALQEASAAHGWSYSLVEGKLGVVEFPPAAGA